MSRSYREHCPGKPANDDYYNYSDGCHTGGGSSYSGSRYQNKRNNYKGNKFVENRHITKQFRDTWDNNYRGDNENYKGANNKNNKGKGKGSSEKHQQHKQRNNYKNNNYSDDNYHNHRGNWKSNNHNNDRDRNGVNDHLQEDVKHYYREKDNQELRNPKAPAVDNEASAVNNDVGVSGEAGEADESCNDDEWRAGVKYNYDDQDSLDNFNYDQADRENADRERLEPEKDLKYARQGGVNEVPAKSYATAEEKIMDEKYPVKSSQKILNLGNPCSVCSYRSNTAYCYFTGEKWYVISFIIDDQYHEQNLNKFVVAFSMDEKKNIAINTLTSTVAQSTMELTELSCLTKPYNVDGVVVIEEHHLYVITAFLLEPPSTMKENGDKWVGFATSSGFTHPYKDLISLFGKFEISKFSEDQRKWPSICKLTYIQESIKKFSVKSGAQAIKNNPNINGNSSSILSSNTGNFYNNDYSSGKWVNMKHLESPEYICQTVNQNCISTIARLYQSKIQGTGSTFKKLSPQMKPNKYNYRNCQPEHYYWLDCPKHYANPITCAPLGDNGYIKVYPHAFDLRKFLTFNWKDEKVDEETNQFIFPKPADYSHNIKLLKQAIHIEKEIEKEQGRVYKETGDPPTTGIVAMALQNTKHNVLNFEMSTFFKTHQNPYGGDTIAIHFKNYLSFVTSFLTREFKYEVEDKLPLQGFNFGNLSDDDWCFRCGLSICQCNNENNNENSDDGQSGNGWGDDDNNENNNGNHDDDANEDNHSHHSSSASSGSDCNGGNHTTNTADKNHLKRDRDDCQDSQSVVSTVPISDVASQHQRDIAQKHRDFQAFCAGTTTLSSTDKHNSHNSDVPPPPPEDDFTGNSVTYAHGFNSKKLGKDIGLEASCVPDKVPNARETVQTQDIHINSVIDDSSSSRDTLSTFLDQTSGLGPSVQMRIPTYSSKSMTKMDVKKINIISYLNDFKSNELQQIIRECEMVEKIKKLDDDDDGDDHLKEYDISTPISPDTPEASVLLTELQIPQLYERVVEKIKSNEITNLPEALLKSIDKIHHKEHGSHNGEYDSDNNYNKSTTTYPQRQASPHPCYNEEQHGARSTLSLSYRPFTASDIQNKVPNARTRPEHLAGIVNPCKNRKGSLSSHTSNSNSHSKSSLNDSKSSSKSSLWERMSGYFSGNKD